MGRNFFRKCFCCFNGHECGKTPRLPRKKKKALKSFFLLTDKYRHKWFMDVPTKCDIASDYKRMKKLFFLIPFIKKYHKELDLMRRYDFEKIYIDDDGRLSWHWESDDDYGGSSGLMPFCYNEKDAGRTWAFSEVESLVCFLLGYPNNFVFPQEIKSDKDLLEFVKKNNHGT